MSGRYFASFVVDIDPDVLPELDSEVGFDPGLTNFAVLSDGTKDGPKPLRQWTCEGCGTVHDRDENAAHNTLAAGRADRLNASQSAGKTGTKAPAPRVEAGSHLGGR